MKLKKTIVFGILLLIIGTNTFAINTKRICVLDTIIIEDIDASNIFLTFQFEFVKNDSAKSNKLMKDQELFLKSYNLPNSGVEEMKTYSTTDHVKLIEQYNVIKESLIGHKYLNLYRQVCSQIIIKYICAEHIMEETKLDRSQGKLSYFLNEMKESGGRNISLIYTSFLLIQYLNTKENICNQISIYIPYCVKIINNNKQDILELKSTEDNKMDPLQDFFYTELSKRLSFDKEYISKLKILERKTCFINPK